jgi:acetoin utilization protein AcuB
MFVFYKMISQKLIVNEITPVHLDDTGVKVLSLMSEFRVLHLPVVDKNNYLGIISEDEIFNMLDEKEQIKTIQNKLSPFFASMDKDVFEVISEINEKNLTLIPMLENGKYFGSITNHSILKALASIIAVKEGGGVIILALNKRDYQMSEIAQIVESNNAKILSSYITEHQNSNMITITLKLNITDLSAIVQTFERYNYSVTAKYQPTNHSSDSISDRYDSLMRYLNI